MKPFSLHPSGSGLALRWALLLAALAIGLVAALFAADPAWPAVFERAWWAQQSARWLAWQGEAPLLFLLGFMLLFTLLSALALPGCAALALIAGTAFGTLAGTLLVGLASTLGALASFLVARHWARERVQRRLGQRLQAVDTAVLRHGLLGLFWLRLLPVVPFPVLNPLLGLSRLSAPAFFWPSLAGLTLGSLPYVWAGQSLRGLLDGVPGPHVELLAAAACIVLSAALVLRRRRAAEAGR